MQNEEEAIASLLQRKRITRATIAQLVEAQEQALQTAQSQVSGIVYAIAPHKHTLFIEDLLSGELLAEFPLPTGDMSETPHQTLSLVQEETGSYHSALPYEADSSYGLVKTSDTHYYYQGSPLSAPYLALTHQALSPFSGQSTGSTYDLHLGEQHLFLVDREGGTLQVLTLATRKLSSPIIVRPRGSEVGINLAIDDHNNRVILTDNQRSDLYILDLNTLQIQPIDMKLEGYSLGNIALSPDSEYIYILTLRPQVELLYYELSTNQLIKKFSLKGEPYTQCQGEQVDLMTLTPDKTHLLIMTCLTEKDPALPVVSVISTEKVKTLRRYSIKEQAKPHQLTCAYPNPVFEHQKSPLQLLLAHGKITPEDLDIAPVDPDEGQGEVPSLAPQKSSNIELAAEKAIPVILKILGDKLYQLAEVALDTVPEEMERMTLEAENIRQGLESFDSVEIDLPEVLEKYTLEALLSRQEVLAAIEEAEIKAQNIVKPPNTCPNCSSELEGSWDCAVCELELDSPQRLEAQEKSSLSPLSNMSSFQLLLADGRNERLCILDRNRTIEWVLSKESLPHKTPWTTLTLPNKNLLVVDQIANTVYECGPSGSLKWEVKQDTPELELNQPVKATYFETPETPLFLIVDQGNHRVFAIDKEQKIHWQYGVIGEAELAPNHLYMPSDIQWTFQGTALIADTGNDRIVEVNRENNKEVASFGEDFGLCAPTFAERLYNGNTLIVDSGNYRVLEIDDLGDVVYECFYFKEEMGDAMRIDYPIHAIRGKRKNLILMDEEKIIELMPHKRQLIWSSLLEHLAKRVEIKGDEGNQDIYSQSFFQYKMPTMDDLIVRLRKDGGKDSGLASRLMENFNRLLEVRRELDSKRAERAKAQTLTDHDFSAAPIFIVDRTFHHILQINRKGKVEWHFGTDPAQRLMRPTHIHQTSDSLFIADTSNRRILEVNRESGKVTLSLGSKKEPLFNQPRSAQVTTRGNILVADQGAKRLVEVNRQGQPIWEFKNLSKISSPYFAAEQGTGTILFVDWALQMVKEIRRDGTVIWAYGQSRRVGNGPNQLSCPEYATRLPEGSTLIADTRNNRIIEVAPNRNILWEFLGENAEIPFEAPNYCQRLPDGHTLIAYDNYRKLIEVDPSGDVHWHFELGSVPMVRAEG